MVRLEEQKFGAWGLPFFLFALAEKVLPTGKKTVGPDIERKQRAGKAENVHFPGSLFGRGATTLSEQPWGLAKWWTSLPWNGR